MPELHVEVDVDTRLLLRYLNAEHGSDRARVPQICHQYCINTHDSEQAPTIAFSQSSMCLV